MPTETLNLELTSVLLVRTKKKTNIEESDKAMLEYSVPFRKRRDAVLPKRGQCPCIGKDFFFFSLYQLCFLGTFTTKPSSNNIFLKNNANGQS